MLSVQMGHQNRRLQGTGITRAPVARRADLARGARARFEIFDGDDSVLGSANLPCRRAGGNFMEAGKDDKSRPSRAHCGIRAVGRSACWEVSELQKCVESGGPQAMIVLIAALVSPIRATGTVAIPAALTGASLPPANTASPKNTMSSL